MEFGLSISTEGSIIFAAASPPRRPGGDGDPQSDQSPTTMPDGLPGLSGRVLDGNGANGRDVLEAAARGVARDGASCVIAEAAGTIPAVGTRKILRSLANSSVTVEPMRPGSRVSTDNRSRCRSGRH